MSSTKNVYKLDQKMVDHLPLSSGAAKIYFDSVVRGFGVSCGKASKSFIVQREVNKRSVRVTIARSTEITVAKAREEARTIIHGMRNGENPNAGKKQPAAPVVTTLQMLVDQHVANLKVRGCKSTAKRYPEMLNKHVADWLMCPVEDATREMVITRHQLIGRETGKSIANAVFRTLRALYNQYRIDHAHFQNPVEILSLKKIWFAEKPRESRIKPNEMQAWYKAVMSLKNRVHQQFMLFVLFNGLRKNEAMSLRWDQVDLNNQSFRIVETKNKKPLELPLSAASLEILEEMKRWAESQGIISPWVFPSLESESGHINETRASIAKVNKLAATKVQLHDLRRTFVSMANSLKIPAYTIKRMINHSVAGDVTASVYAIIDTDDLRVPMEQISQKMLEMMNGR